LTTPVSKDKFAALQDSLSQLQISAPNREMSALAQHMLAQALLINDRNRDAADAFAAAENKWSEVGDFERALVARVARTEDERRTGNYAKAIHLTEEVPQSWPAHSYFRTRLENSRCLALNSLGRFAESDACYTTTLGALRAADERGELVDTLYDYAALLTTRGMDEAAMAIAQQALSEAAGIDIPYVHGHIRYLLGWLAFRRGEVAQSLAFSNEALAFFERAHMPRWEANALFDICNIYLDMGAYDEALASLQQAVKRLSYRDAPSRMATAMILFARIERGNGELDSALLWSRAAQSSFEQLKMPLDRDAAELLRLQILADQGRVTEADAIVSRHLNERSLLGLTWHLLALRGAIETGAEDVANSAIAALRDANLPLPNRVEFFLREAQWLARKGDAQGAQKALYDGALKLIAIASQSQAPAVRYLIAKQAVALRRAAFDLSLADVFEATVPGGTDLFWRWLTLSNPAERSTAAQQQTTAFDHAVAKELLMPSTRVNTPGEVSAQRELLALLAQPARPATQNGNMLGVSTLAEFQATLPADAALICYLDGNTRGGMFWITHAEAKIVSAAAPASIRSNVLALRDYVRSPESASVDIQREAENLSKQLLDATPLSTPPKHLFVLNDPTLAGAVWGLLHWPGHSEPLVETTTVSLVNLSESKLNSAQATATDSAPLLHLIVAAQTDTGIDSLPALAGAVTEASQIRAILSGNSLGVVDDTRATRQSILQTLSDKDAWIHVAAHGIAQPLRIGYSGIWLEPSGDHVTPEFLSWIDVLGTDARAGLVVLNACDLADNGGSDYANLSFATAVSRAGAKQVVAAEWAVSDSAAALWVPAFYSALIADPDHSAPAALRVAQLRLRNTRAFAHPFFWAGFEAFTQLPLPYSPPEGVPNRKSTLH